MLMSEFVARTGLSPVEVYYRWGEIMKEYNARGEHKNDFCLRWLRRNKRDLTHYRLWLERYNSGGLLPPGFLGLD